MELDEMLTLSADCWETTSSMKALFILLFLKLAGFWLHFE